MYSFPYLEPVYWSMSGCNCCFLTCIQVSQKAGKVVWYSHLFKNFPQFVVIHTAKSFAIVNKAEIDVFLEFSCLFYDPVDVGNLISSSSAFSKSSLYIWKFSVHVLLKPSLEDFAHHLAGKWNKCNCAVVSTSVLPVNIQDWFPLGWTGWISLQSKGLSRVFSNTTVWKHQFFGAQLSLWPNSHIHTWPLEKP